MDSFVKLFLLIFTIFTYLVTFAEAIRILRSAYLYGHLHYLSRLWLIISSKMFPSLIVRFLDFTNYDIEIQIAKLNSNNRDEQLRALDHLEQIVIFLYSKDGNKIARIRRVMYRLLWNTHTELSVVQRATEILCKNHILQPKNEQRNRT